MKSKRPKRFGALRIALIFMAIGATYIAFSDYLLLNVLSKTISPETLNTIQSYKGPAFVFLTAVVLFILIQREIYTSRSTIGKLEKQQKILKKVVAEKDEATRKYYPLFKLNPAPIVIFRMKDGRILEANDSCIQLLGYSKKELLESTTSGISVWKNPGDYKKMIESLGKNLSLEAFEAQAVRKNGEVIDTLSYLQKVKTGGEPSILAVILDVTKTRENQRKLQDSKNLLEKTINNLNEAVIVADQYQNILMANETVEIVFGYKPEEIKDKGISVLHLNEESFRKLHEMGRPELENNGIYHTIYPMQRKDGTAIETEITTTVIAGKDDPSPINISILRDVTERVKNEKKLQEYQESLKQLTTEQSLAEEKQRKEMATNINNHLSQLLVISKVRISELAERLYSEDDKEDAKVVANYISEALENTRKITYDLSPPVLYETGLVETIHWLAGKTKKEREIEVDFKTNTNEINLPESKLILTYQTIRELVNNTIKHAQADQLEIQLKRKNNSVVVVVTDNGKGFETTDILGKRIKNTGFGLFALRERVHNLGGSFEINSKPGVGTTVNFSVPLSD